MLKGYHPQKQSAKPTSKAVPSWRDGLLRFRRPPHSSASSFSALVRIFRPRLRVASRSHPPVDGHPDGVYDALTDIETNLTSLVRCFHHLRVQEAPE